MAGRLKPIVITTFGGVVEEGSSEDIAPEDFRYALNVFVTKEGALETRYGWVAENANAAVSANAGTAVFFHGNKVVVTDGGSYWHATIYTEH